MSSNCPDLTVSIVNTNNCKLLQACLESLHAQASGQYFMEVYVVDNVSTDGSAEMVRKQFPAVHLICNEQREGFGANHNKVLRVGQGRYLLVLNEDTVILDAALDKLTAFADSHPEAGMVGPRTLNTDGSLQNTCVRFPTFCRKLKSIALQRFSDYDVLAYPPADHDSIVDVEWLRGSCMLVRRDAMRQVGLLDERFFIFYEEVDWCYRMREAGWSNVYCPSAVIIHAGKQTVSKETPTTGGSKSIAMAAQMSLSEHLYFDKHYPFSGGPLMRLLNSCYIPFRILKTYLRLRSASAAQSEWDRKLLRHLFWLATRSPRRLVDIGRVPGGIVESHAR